MSNFRHNGGPPIEDEHVPEWGRGGIGGYFSWKGAHDEVWKKVSWETMMRRQRRAEAIGLTYEEYTLELLERGRHLGPDDGERIAAIKQARNAPTLVDLPARARGAREDVSPRPHPRPVRASLSPRVRPGRPSW
ncbi:hypothetical protein [uncultured Enterovirga sp.]|uniref:hypothetical protein n=1 Tax=uncultured Enterovirga sp. TaxID=2026352 RepID=UPI0035CAFF7D